MYTKREGFTLIELLIVVAIIAILAAIAIPNFLAAQVRAKVARAKGEMKSVATGIESYYVDETAYPTMYLALNSRLPNSLTTPVSYLGSAALFDLFQYDQDPSGTFPPAIFKRYRYHNIKEFIEGGYTGWTNPDDYLRYGQWRLVCVGPNRTYQAWEMYDPTNGTISNGDIMRTQISPSGEIMYKPYVP